MFPFISGHYREPVLPERRGQCAGQEGTESCLFVLLSGESKVGILRHSFPPSPIFSGQRRGQSGSNERSFRFTAQKDHSTTTVIKKELDMSTAPTKALSNRRSRARKCLVIRRELSR